jgi:hypothetical protein
MFLNDMLECDELWTNFPLLTTINWGDSW